MKYPILVIVVALCHSCNNSTFTNENVSDSKKLDITLVDSLGIITVNVPLRYDTVFSWIHYSDCNTCHLQKYRVQTKKTPIIRESGFYWDKPNDSVDRFTISHNQYLPSHVNDTTMILNMHSHYKNDLKYTRKGMKILTDTIQKINDRYFSIFQLENSDSVLRKEILAITTIKGNFINFSCELMMKKDNKLARDFFVNSSKLINSIRIKSVK